MNRWWSGGKRHPWMTWSLVILAFLAAGPPSEMLGVLRVGVAKTDIIPEGTLPCFG